MVENLVSSIPQDFKERQIHMTEESSRKWFDELPAILEKVITQWEVYDCHLVEEMSFNNVIFYASSPQYGGVVVKIGHPAYELFFSEPEALRFYEGQDACKLYDLDSKNRAMLLERISPGIQLSEIGDMRERISIAANLLRKISKPLCVPNHRIIGYEEMIPDYFQRAKTETKDNSQILALCGTAQQFFTEIISGKHVRVLTHGDYHYRNILLGEEGFKVIDPKGVAGFGFMDTAQLISNELRMANGTTGFSHLDRAVNLVSKHTGYSIKLLSKWLFIASVWKVAGNVLYIKGNSEKTREKVERSELYLEYYQQV